MSGPPAGRRARHSGRMAGRKRRRLAGFRRRLAGHQAHPRRARRAGRSGVRHQPRPPAAQSQDLHRSEIPPAAREKLQQSLVLVHGGMAQDVGPILEMVTEKYLLRSETEWLGRRQAIAILDEIAGHLERGDIRALGAVPAAQLRRPRADHYSVGRQPLHRHADRPRAQEFGDDFWGFWMLGGMSGGGMGFLFCPERKAEAQERMQAIMSETKRQMEHSVPFAMEPVVYDFAINEHGTQAALLSGDDALMPAGYYTLHVPPLMRTEFAPALARAPRRAGALHRGLPHHAGIRGHDSALFDRMLPAGQAGSGPQRNSLDALLDSFGFDRAAA